MKIILHFTELKLLPRKVRKGNLVNLSFPYVEIYPYGDCWNKAYFLVGETEN